MKKTTRIRAVPLLLLLLIQSAAGCTAPQETGGSDDRLSSVSDETTLVPNEDASGKEAYFAALPAVSEPGAEISFITINNGDADMGLNDIATEEENGGKMNDAIYQREREVEERLDVSVVWVGYDDDTDLQKTVSNDTLSGSGVFDIIDAKTFSIASFFNNGYLMDLNDIPHLQTEQPWWNRDANRSFSFAGIQFTALSSLSHFADAVAWLVMFNKNMFDEYDLTYPYQLVRDGKWTIDAMYEMMKTVPLDSNGDGIADYKDRVGCISQAFDALALTTAFGCNLFEKGSDDIPVFSLADEDNFNKLERVTALYEDTARTIAVDMYTSVVKNVWSELWTDKFIAGDGMFMLNCPGNLIEFTNMEQDFGILPLPKYSEDQENYRTMTSLWFTISLAVPTIHEADDSDIGIVLDAMSYLSYVDVEPLFTEVYLENRYIRDEESAEMLNIVTHTKYYDPGFVFNWNGSMQLPHYCAIGKGGQLASTIESSRKNIEKSTAASLEQAKAMGS